jgi:glyoxylase-like metal-dependent hydrolase (beta-lactamase superfamily II)
MVRIHPLRDTPGRHHSGQSAAATTLTRRQIIAGTGAIAATAFAPCASAATSPAKSQAPGFYRYRLGSFQLTALYDGEWDVPIGDDFIRNASRFQVDRALAGGFLAPGILPISFTALLVNTGSKLVLIDTGTAGQLTDSAGDLAANLRAAGIAPKAIDIILISHFHPDHINGIKTKDGERVFPNAEIKVPAPEWKFWMDDANLRAASGPIRRYFLNARRIFRDIAHDVTRFEPGGEVAPGINSFAAYGHTPGHTAFTISSGQSNLLVLGDSVRNPWLFVRNPDWQPDFDMDGALAVETRRHLLDRAAADKMPVQGYHFPFPAAGHIVKNARRFDYVPAMWRPL